VNTSKFNPGRVLIVDDTAANLQLLAKILMEQGYIVHPATDGEMALRFIQSVLPDLILLDIKLPEMDGYEVCRRLKESERTRSIPIIFISVLENEQDKVKGFQAGGVDYITKPFRPEEVTARIRTHLRLRELTVSLEQKVQERTKELLLITEQLREELAERKKAEDALRENENRLRQLNKELNTTIEKLAVANKELESFSYSVAHDLRNPLKVINDFADFLIQDYVERLDKEGRDCLEKIKKSTRRMNSIIDDMLLLSKISLQEIKIVDLDLSELARLAINELSSANPNRKVTAKIQNGLKAQADARLMSVTLGNLLGNAWKYTEKTLHPEIEFGAFEKDGQRIFFVKDNGVGFDMNQTEKLFVPFQRLHSEKEFKGIGVGLAIVERAISRLGGKIWAEGEVGHGAQFNFTISTGRDVLRE
jgi:signal transduction histidine kinase